MNSKIWIVIGGLFVLITGAAVFGIMNSKQNSTPGTTHPAQTSPQQPATEAQTPGVYTDYDAAKVAAAQGKKILFFHAPWCPQCRALETSIKQEGVPSGVNIFKVNYDTASDLKQRYGITLQTTVVEIDQNGNALKKFVAYNDPSLSAVLTALGK